jgi:hypothetical protein
MGSRRGKVSFWHIPAQCIGGADNVLEGHCRASIRPENALVLQLHLNCLRHNEIARKIHFQTRRKMQLY